MKNKILKISVLVIMIIVIMIIVMMFILTGCNQTIIDTNYTFDRAIVVLNNNTKMEIQIKEWTDYSDGEQLQIKGKDGKTYLVSSFNTILIKDE